MLRTLILRFIVVVGIGIINGCAAPSSDKQPNIIFILADDLGYGDVSCYNEEGKIATPHIDRLAANGIRFTDAHSGSAVCTPTRYGFLTGRYAWRSRLKRSVLNGVSPPLIEKGRMTVASLLKSQGYHTAMIGKWHLGWDFQFKTDARPKAIPDSFSYDPNKLPIDYTKPVRNGPNVNGFDEYFAICGSLDMNPYVYVENGRITAAPDRVTENTEKRFWRKGLTGADFKHIEVMPTFVERSVQYIERRAQTGQPFFLYLALPGPHTPILPVAEFEGSTRTNHYGDFVAQCDAHVGEIVTALRQAGILDNTMLIFTSDNGCSPMANFKELAAVGHNPNYIYRGHKADIFEGGHRVPYIVQWPAAIRPGQVSDETICLTDTLATVAEELGVKLPDNAGEDSVSHLSVLLGKASGPVRQATVHHSFDGVFAIRQGHWKLIFNPGSGGWSYPSPFSDAALLKTLPPLQLYNLNEDPGEKQNLLNDYPEKVRYLTDLMDKYVKQGRSTPGVAQSNDGETVFQTQVEDHVGGDSGIEYKKEDSTH